MIMTYATVKDEGVVIAEESTSPSPMQPFDAIEQVSSSSSSNLELITLEREIFPQPEKKDPTTSMHYSDALEDDDEMSDNENFENDDDDDGDAFQGEGGRSSRGKWTQEEDETLREAVQRHGGRNWKRISDCLVGRTDVQCLHRWQKVLRPGLIKGPWTKEVQYTTTCSIPI